MVTNATTIEEQLASLTRAIEGLTKHVQEQDAQIAWLINKADNVDASHIMGKQVEAHDEVEALQINIILKRIRTIRSKIVGSSKSSLTYSKPHTARKNGLKMPMGYQPPKFQQFDGKGNPKQHVAHFVETCNNAGTYGDHLVKQFVRSLKGNAFDWATCPGASQKQGETRSEERGKLFSKAPSKESMAVNVALFKLKSTAKDNVAPRNNVPYERPQRKLNLKKMQAREYPFLDSDVPGIFDDLLEANLIDLPEMKRPEEAERKDDQNITNTIA
ncbi:hypothetical protein Sango_1911900 [Sesamum angolense]|uniref:Uncharacterized protein n=1 Tax=Sesamum angolense TaxID=2727404 RepID=A0AAE1WJJ8_9LAMI|nr:hypothetical protein Sango_1911900 [Sesamum angolense]